MCSVSLFVFRDPPYQTLSLNSKEDGWIQLFAVDVFIPVTNTGEQGGYCGIEFAKS